MQKTIEAFKNDLSVQRTGRANPAVLEGIKVDYYGQLTPLNQVGNISVPDPRTIQIHPWDKSLCPIIERAILEANIGLTPVNNGALIRLPVPELSEERRKEIVKQCKKIAEESKVAVRNIRRDGNEAVKKQEKDKTISEDESKKLQDRIQKLTDSYVKQIDDILVKKEQEIMQV
ncbi:MAG: ribosome recycling factor [Candidatus Raymondbacteria bacterium RifOxyA12_full_50_37]|uniref:Ribosome-recycling factor n=1 Tax=Candidatus Raymondbacteria bacterium RIFOXYD12_FULL_49_13 TaxID=1817890 RepID=A0A1F7FAZ9_UNCRA|nr:MAG: ribosome recycling factor [Candidatus Raymondbacteria bacterium RifOxyA12_full_50_37]OGJ92407.1 MAG: ribosome recycling factor [Candidatus Raymondbacteria bacterium RIFOXYA2_FULL_49_16]OGJ98762.1 MAG: ribosome recycling factor [Candidatus Raymondbacteria bacterium RifOxyB12_full_50_8]OGJ99388.1 MAG: ribosome recycling factor [Candidatus Raymondbacteria bacterium RIFOXYC2_FULL_50_21]OGK03656.1 MAG: ribosome recycling factor [Candidatus Raymondbacteria bacterium RIFOXYD12_FULL_49_13]OGP4